MLTGHGDVSMAVQALRAFVYGLGAYQQAGVTKALEILREELDVAMALTGLTNAADVPRSVLLGTAG